MMVQPKRAPTKMRIRGEKEGVILGISVNKECEIHGKDFIAQLRKGPRYSYHPTPFTLSLSDLRKKFHHFIQNPTLVSGFMNARDVLRILQSILNDNLSW